MAGTDAPEGRGRKLYWRSHCHRQKRFCINMGSGVSLFTVSLIEGLVAFFPHVRGFWEHVRQFIPRLRLFFLFKVEISSRTLSPLFWPESVHSGLAS